MHILHIYIYIYIALYAYISYCISYCIISYFTPLLSDRGCGWGSISLSSMIPLFHTHVKCCSQIIYRLTRMKQLLCSA